MRARVLLIALCLSSCSRKHDVLIENDVDPSAPATVLVFGEPVPSTTEGSMLRTRVPGGTVRRRGKDGVNTTACVLPCSPQESPGRYLTVRVETKACGPVELCVGFPKDFALPAKGEAARGTIRWRRRPEYATCTEEVHRLFVDNRGGVARKLTVGGIARDVAPDAVTTIEVPAPPCAAMADVALDGESIGTLPVFPENPEYQSLRPRDFVIDPTASRCYQAATVSYTPNGSAAGGSDPVLQDLDTAWLHAVRARLDTPFLEKAPERIDTYAGYGTRTQLIETACRNPE